MLKTGEEITEVDNSGFNVQEPTVFACNLTNNKYILQFCQSCIYLLEGATKINEIILEEDGPTIVTVSSQDPHTILLMSDGKIRYLELVKDYEKPSMKLTEPILSQRSQVYLHSIKN